MEDLREELIGKAIGLTKKPEQTINGVKQAADDMNVIDHAMETAKKLAGTSALSEELQRKGELLAKSDAEKDKIKDELHDTQIQLIQKELGSKIDQLSEAIKGGASPKSIGDQITEVKKAAESLGLGGSKVSEIKEIMDLVKSLSPQQKGLAEQVKEARDLLVTLQPEGKRESLVEGLPASVAIQLKEMDNNLKITLAKMEDARQAGDREFKLKLIEFEDTRAFKKQEIEGKIAADRERNQILSGTLEIIGRAAGKAFAEGAGGETEPGSISQKQPGAPQTYKARAKEGEHGEIKCPNCNAMVGIGPTTTLATCIGCGSKFDIERVAATKTSAEPLPTKEEE